MFIDSLNVPQRKLFFQSKHPTHRNFKLGKTFPWTGSWLKLIAYKAEWVQSDHIISQWPWLVIACISLRAFFDAPILLRSILEWLFQSHFKFFKTKRHKTWQNFQNFCWIQFSLHQDSIQSFDRDISVIFYNMSNHNIQNYINMKAR